MERKTSDPRRILFAWIILAVSLLIIFSYFLSMLFGLAIMFSTTDGRDFRAKSVQPYLLLPSQKLMPINVGTFFLILWTVYLLCFFAALLSREDYASTILKLRRMKDLFRNNLLSMPMLASALFMTVSLIQRIQEEIGLPTQKSSEGLTPDALELFLGLTYSPIIEEITFRLIPIGLVAVVYITITMSQQTPTNSLSNVIKTAFKAFLQPEKAKKENSIKSIGSSGIFRGINLAEWSMIIAMSIVFGLAHYPFGSWGPGKLLSASLSGFFLGVVYVAYGIQASILLHWYFNYYLYTLNLARTYFATASFTFVFFYIINLFLGASVYFLLFYGLLNRVFKRNVEF